nr:MAG: GDSL-like lipase/acylhydrolase family protein [Bacteriophage sp.]
MGKIKKILENELIGGTQGTDVYPVTSVMAVYDAENVRLDTILGYSCKTLNKGNFIKVVNDKLFLNVIRGVGSASCSNFLKLYTGAKLTLYNIAKYTNVGYANVPAILFFDKNFSYISSIKSTETILEVSTSEIPLNAVYFIIQSNGTAIPYVVPDSGELSIIDTGVSISISTQVEEISTQVEEISIDVNNLAGTALKLKNIPVTTDYCINKSSGAVQRYTGGAITDYQSMSGVTEITYTGIYGKNACMVAFYSADMKFISSVGDSTTIVTKTDYKISSLPSKAVYFRVSFINYDSTKHSVRTNLMEGKQYVDIDTLETGIKNVDNKVDTLETKIDNISPNIKTEYNVSNLDVTNLQESNYFGSLFSRRITINTIKYIAGKTKTANKIIIGTFSADTRVIIIDSIITIPDAVVGENTISNLNIEIVPNQVLYILGNDRYVNSNSSKFGDELVSCLSTFSNGIADSPEGGAAVVNQTLTSAAKAIQIIGSITEPITEEYISSLVSKQVKAITPNYLYGKVLSVTGDSEAAGHSIGKQNTYGNLIAARNGMTINNYAVNGRKLAHVEDSLGSGTPLVDSITEFASDSDYILVQIGYNDTFDSAEDDDSTDISKYKGAFNTYISGVLGNYPNAKIGIISPYYFNNQQARIDKMNWMKERCKHFHIQFIDGTAISGLNSDVASQSSYFIDAVHLTALGHERMSYIYENFLRGL